MATTSDSDQQETARLTAALAASEARVATIGRTLHACRGIIHEGLHGGRATVHEHQELCQRPACRWIRAVLAGTAAPGTGDRREPAIGPCPACLDRRTRGNGGDDRACMACGLRWSLSAPRGRR